MTASAVLQRKCACGSAAAKSGECAQCAQRKQEIQRKHSDGKEPERVPPIVESVIGSPGKPLEAATLATMESRFGHRFGDVRIHADERAGQSARAVNAQAYAVRNHIAVQPGLYKPETAAGERLIAHELAHVAQQRHTSAAGPLTIGDAHSEAEVEADRKADSVVKGNAAESVGPAAPGLRRLPNSEDKLPANPGYELNVDPKLTAQFLALCDMGKADPRLCGEVRAKSQGKPLPPAPPTIANLNPANFDFKDMVNKPTFGVPPGSAASPLAPLAGKPPGAPGAAPQGKPFEFPDFSGVKKVIDKVTKFHIQLSTGTIDISLPTSITAKFRPLANAKSVIISASAGIAGTLTAGVTIDSQFPLSLTGKVDAGSKTASLSLTLDSAAIGSPCELKVPAEAIAKVTDARDKLVALVQQRVTNQQPAPPPLVTPGKKPDPPPNLKIAPFTPDPKKSNTENDVDRIGHDIGEGVRVGVAAIGGVVDEVKGKVEPIIDSVQPEIDLAGAIAAFVEAVSAVKDKNKQKCGPTVRFGVTGQVPLGDRDPNAPGLGSALHFGMVGSF
jgi:hypothetical protein